MPEEKVAQTRRTTSHRGSSHVESHSQWKPRRASTSRAKLSSVAAVGVCWLTAVAAGGCGGAGLSGQQPDVAESVRSAEPTHTATGAESEEKPAEACSRVLSAMVRDRYGYVMKQRPKGMSEHQAVSSHADAYEIEVVRSLDKPPVSVRHSCTSAGIALLGSTAEERTLDVYDPPLVVFPVGASTGHEWRWTPGENAIGNEGTKLIAGEVVGRETIEAGGKSWETTHVKMRYYTKSVLKPSMEVDRWVAFDPYYVEVATSVSLPGAPNALGRVLVSEGRDDGEDRISMKIDSPPLE